MAGQHEAVVLIHGLAGSRLVLLPLWARMRRRWPKSKIWSYNSWRYSIDHHSGKLSQFFEHECATYHRIHVIAHSMGSIVLRAALANRVPDNFGRTVFLGPPHQGTPMADKFCNWWGQRWQTVAELKSGEDSFVNRLPAWRYGQACVIRAEGDFMVPPERVQLEGIDQYASVPGPHSYLLFSAKAARLAIRFIEDGHLPPDAVHKPEPLPDAVDSHRHR